MGAGADAPKVGAAVGASAWRRREAQVAAQQQRKRGKASVLASKGKTEDG